MTYDGFQPVTKDELHTAVVLKKKIQAIKMYRERTGADLADAKREIESAMEDYYRAKRQIHIDQFLSKVLDTAVVLTHMNAAVLRATRPRATDLQAMQRDRRTFISSVNAYLGDLLYDLDKLDGK